MSNSTQNCQFPCHYLEQWRNFYVGRGNNCILVLLSKGKYVIDMYYAHIFVEHSLIKHRCTVSLASDRCEESIVRVSNSNFPYNVVYFWSLFTVAFKIESFSYTGSPVHWSSHHYSADRQKVRVELDWEVSCAYLTTIAYKNCFTTFFQIKNKLASNIYFKGANWNCIWF